jgi:hypothetical protein
VPHILLLIFLFRLISKFTIIFHSCLPAGR